MIADSPEVDIQMKPRHLDTSALDTPALALTNAARETLRIGDVLEQMLRLYRDVLRGDHMQRREIRRLDDDVDVLSAAKLFLKRHFTQVDIEQNPERIPFLITNGNYDVVLLDMNFTRDVNTGKEGFEWLDRILDIDPLIAVVLFTAYGDVEMAVRAIKVGAVDFVLKPWENTKLLETMQSSFEMRQEKIGGGQTAVGSKKIISKS